MPMEITKLPSCLSHQITEEYIDIMDHMNIHYYVKLFNAAALNFFNSFGFDEAYYNKTNNGVFALEQHIRYYKEVRLGERVQIYFRAIDRSDKVLHYMLFMIHEKDNSLAATTELISAHIDKVSRLTSPFSPEISQQLDLLLAEHQSLDWDPPVCGVMGPKNNNKK